MQRSLPFTVFSCRPRLYHSISKRVSVPTSRSFSDNAHSFGQTREQPSQGNSTSKSDHQSKESIRESLLQASLKYIPEHGWSNECLAHAAKELGLPPLAHRVVRRGSPEIVQYIMNKKREYVQKVILNHQMDGDSENRSSTAEGSSTNFDTDHEEFNEGDLKLAIWSNLEYLQPYRSSWAEAIAISLHPNEIPYSLPTVFTLIDDLCHYADIKSSRLDWYTERALMMYLYGSTELFMLTDTSDANIDTRHFLEQNMTYYKWLRKSPKSFQSILPRFF